MAGRPSLVGRRALLIIGGLLVAAPAPAAAVAPAPGARYDGVDATRARYFVRANGAADTLSDYEVGTPVACTDGKRRLLALRAKGDSPTRIGADGRFAHSVSTPGFSYSDKPGARNTGRARTTFSGQFVSADRATLTITNSFRSAGLSCTGKTTTITFHRDGTRAAPFRNSTLATGRYRAKGRRVRFSSIRTLAPAGLVTALKFSARVSCRDGSYYSSPYSFTPFTLTRSHDTAQVQTGSDRFSLGRGYRTRERYRVSIGFLRSTGRYRVRGRVRLRATVTLRGRRVTTCSANRRYAGVFTAGPKNLF